MAEREAEKPVLPITGASSGIGAAARAAAPSHRLVLAVRAVMFALEQPAGVDVNEILIRPTSRPT